MENKDINLFDSKALTRKIFDSWAYILLVLVLTMSVLSGFTEMGLSLDATVNVGMSYIVLLLFCYTARYSFDGIAKARAAETEIYKDAIVRHENLRTRIKAYNGEAFEAFCSHYRAEELAAVRKQILEEAMLSDSDFTAYIESGKLPATMPFAQKLALKKAHRAKPIHLNRFMIGRPIVERTERQSYESPEKQLFRKSLPSFLSTALTVIFPVSLSFSVIVDPSMAVLFGALLKTLTVLLAGVKGYSARYRSMTETVPAYVRRQEDFCDAFEKWLEESHEL